MSTYIALLRGINVGGHAKVAMVDLRRLVEGVGGSDVRTYLQSGNAVFGFEGDSAGLGGRVEQALTADLGLSVKVILRLRDELADVVDSNPFPEATGTPTLLHAMFLGAPMTPAVLRDLDAAPVAPDQFRVGHEVLYLWLPNGMGRSKLPGYLSERRLGVPATTRNWNTVTKLLEMAGT